MAIKVEFKFEPSAYNTTNMVSTGFASLAILAFAFALWREKKEEED